MNQFVELQEVPSPSNCPIFNGNGMCMCASMACDDVKDFHRASMRFAFTYGYNTMAQRANEWENSEQILKEAGEYADNPILNNAT